MCANYCDISLWLGDSGVIRVLKCGNSCVSCSFFGHVSMISFSNWKYCARSSYQGQGQVITSPVSAGCNYLSLPLIPASDTTLMNWLSTVIILFSQQYIIWVCVPTEKHTFGPSGEYLETRFSQVTINTQYNSSYWYYGFQICVNHGSRSRHAFKVIDFYIFRE